MTSFALNADGYYYAPPIDPDEELDYTLDLTGVLGADTISSVSWAATTGITEVTAKRSNTTATATVWLKLATLGGIFTVTASVTSVGGRKLDRSFKIKCQSL